MSSISFRTRIYNDKKAQIMILDYTKIAPINWADLLIANYYISSDVWHENII